MNLFAKLKQRHRYREETYEYQGGRGGGMNWEIGIDIYIDWASLVAQMVKNPPATRETWAQSLVGKIPWRRERLPTPIFWPREFHGLYSSCCRKKSDTTERLPLSLYILLRIKQMANEIQHQELYSVLCGDLNRKEIQKRGDICICIADSLCCTVENNIIKQLYSNKNLKRRLQN